MSTSDTGRTGSHSVTPRVEPDLDRRFSGQQTIRSQHLWWGALIAFCVICSVATIVVPAIFMIGLAGVIVSVILVFKYPFIGVLIYLVIFMVRPAEMYPALEALRIERMVGILVLVAVMIRHKREHGNLHFPKDFSSRALFGFFAVLCVSMTWSYDPGSTQWLIENLIKLMVFFFLIVYEVNSKTRFNIFVITFCLLVGWIAFLSFRDYYGGGYIVRMGIQRAIGRTSAGGDANTLAAILATTIPLVIAVFRIYRHSLIRLAWIGLLGLMLLMIVNTGSRSGLLTLMVVCGALVYFSEYKLTALVVAVVVMIGGWFVLPDQYKERYMTLVDDDRDVDEVSSGRVAIWENGLRMIAAKPIFGVGGGGFQKANASGEFGPSIDMKPHSLYVQIFASYGLVGGAVWVAFLVSLIRSQTRRRPDDDEDDDDEDRESMIVGRGEWFDIMRRSLFSMICGLMLSGIFGHSLFRYTWYLIAAMTIALVAIYFRTTPDTERRAELGEDDDDELAEDSESLKSAPA